MNLLDILIYKDDENTGIKRISKTKVITLIVFVAFFLFAMNLYLTSPEYSDMMALSVFAAILFGLFFAVPVFVMGWLISKFLNRNNPNNPKNTIKQDYNPSDVPNSYNNTGNITSCPHDNAMKFKNAIDANDSNLAESILSNWEDNDANYFYARIIFEGLPPVSVELSELNTWLNTANTMKSCDESLRPWFNSTAIKVINMNK